MVYVSTSITPTTSDWSLIMTHQNPKFGSALSLGSHVPFTAAVMVASLGCLLIPTAASLPTIVLYVYVMDTGLGVILCHGNTLCTWANAENPAPALNLLNGGFGAGVGKYGIGLRGQA
jgi:hypothetical protein